MLRRLYYALPAKFRFTVRRLYYFPIDLIEGLIGKRDPLTPPKGMIFTGSGDFRNQGRHLLHLFEKLGNLKPYHRVLDIGSGIGRSAVALTSFLNNEGTYQGFDPIEKGINWCKKNITSRYPKFKFDYIPLKNDLYRDDGASASNFTFPYPDDSFDFIILTSVFTHMVSAEVDNYLSEINRVLSSNGVVFATFFVLTEESKKLSANNSFQFKFKNGNDWLMDEKVVSANVAFDEDFLHQSLVEKNDLKIEAFFNGYWSGRDKKECKDFQDVLILKKA